MVSSETTPAAVRARILETARRRFFREGYARVTMDELARALGMSKKTLYQHFPTKAALAAAVMETFRSQVAEGLGRIFSDHTLSLPERLARAFAEAARHLRQIEKPFLEDLARFLPDVWAETERFRSETIARLLGNALREGQAAGFIRTDVPVEIMLRSFQAVAERLVTPSALMELPYTLPEMIRLVIRLLFEGVLTDAARADFRKALDAIASGENLTT
ncbi:transcriptional regulator, TetR family [Rhodothermus marinus DSM 4252]|uniref:Transcriptional regulator, TetR family n=1 Tax=Rhodothermus marinus (strain ATCC 43812 / DSM 4252 / R-10) TaxID=518766 RepID=D0MJK2_RHOM4|nr:transcriptional regulator, TetR family [Rhodothermus marinus DSM 4252]